MNLKKVTSIIVIALIICMFFSASVFAVTAQDNGKLKVYPTTTGYEGFYTDGGFDIKGYVNNDEDLISSTYGDYGYHTFLNVNGANGKMIGSLEPTEPDYPTEPVDEPYSTEPDRADFATDEEYELAYTAWEDDCDEVELRNTNATNAWQAECDRLDEEYDNASSANTLRAQIKNMLYSGTGIQRINGIDLSVDTSFVNEGKFIKIIYTLKNTTEATATYSLATTSDVQIDGDDSAAIRRGGDGNISLYTNEGNTSKPVQFVFYGKNVTGATNIDNLWIGDWSNEYVYNMFNNNPSITQIEDTDSAFCFSWVNKSIAAGETKTHSVVMTVGELNGPTVTLTTPNNNIFESASVKINGNVKDVDLIDTATVSYKVDNGNEVVLPVMQMNGTAKDFAIDLTSLNLSKGTEHSIEVWAVDSQNNMSNKAKINFTVSDLKLININSEHEIWEDTDAIFNLTDTLNDKTKVAKYQYKINNGEWQDGELSKNYVALSTEGTVTVYARAVGVEANDFGPVVSKVLKVKTATIDEVETGDLSGNASGNTSGTANGNVNNTSNEQNAEKDNTPKTGSVNFKDIIISVVSFLVLGIIIFDIRRKIKK